VSRGLALDGRRALVTGASGGLGAAIARALAARGARVLLTGRREDALAALAAELPGAEWSVADLADPAAAEALATRAGALDVLVANAALPASGPVWEHTDAQVERAVHVNLLAPMLLARRLAPAMVARGRGHLVFVSSLAGRAAPAGSAVYSATKYGLRGFALALRQDLHGSGVGVSLVTPGFVRGAGMFADSRVRLPPGVGTATPEDVGRAVLRAIARNRAEVDVAPLGLRLGVLLSAAAPDAAAALSRRLGSARVAAEMAGAQRAKR
jgi:short-subunit dehydrogenase